MTTAMTAMKRSVPQLPILTRNSLSFFKARIPLLHRRIKGQAPTRSLLRIHDGFDLGFWKLVAELVVDRGHGLLEALAVHVSNDGNGPGGYLLQPGLFGIAVNLALKPAHLQGGPQEQLLVLLGHYVKRLLAHQQRSRGIHMCGEGEVLLTGVPQLRTVKDRNRVFLAVND